MQGKVQTAHEGWGEGVRFPPGVDLGAVPVVQRVQLLGNGGNLLHSILQHEACNVGTVRYRVQILQHEALYTVRGSDPSTSNVLYMVQGSVPSLPKNSLILSKSKIYRISLNYASTNINF